MHYWYLYIWAGSIDKSRRIVSRKYFHLFLSRVAQCRSNNVSFFNCTRGRSDFWRRINVDCRSRPQSASGDHENVQWDRTVDRYLCPLAATRAVAVKHSKSGLRIMTGMYPCKYRRKLCHRLKAPAFCGKEFHTTTIVSLFETLLPTKSVFVRLMKCQ